MCSLIYAHGAKIGVVQPRYSQEEFARRGDNTYKRDVRPHVKTEDEGKFVLIDIETGDYEMDVDELAASDCLLARHANAQVSRSLSFQCGL